MVLFCWLTVPVINGSNICITSPKRHYFSLWRFLFYRLKTYITLLSCKELIVTTNPDARFWVKKQTASCLILISLMSWENLTQSLNDTGNYFAVCVHFETSNAFVRGDQILAKTNTARVIIQRQLAGLPQCLYCQWKYFRGTCNFWARAFVKRCLLPPGLKGNSMYVCIPIWWT